MSYINMTEEMDKFNRDIENNSLKYNELRKKVISILGEVDYRGLYSFFLKLLSDKTLSYLVIMSRRCLVLCQIFIPFIVMDKQQLNGKLVVLSDKAIPYYANKMNGKVVVADDILIHGRTIRKVYRLLKSINRELELYVHGYKKDIDMDLKELKEITTVCGDEYKTVWRNLSNRLVRCIYASNVPYTSFVSAFFQYDNKSIWERLMSIDEIKKLDNTEECQADEGLYSKYCYEEETDNEYPLFKVLLIAKSVRLYWNDCIQKLTIIPYVFIKRINVLDAQLLFTGVADRMPENYRALIDALNKESEISNINDALITYKMRLLTCLLSRLYWLDFVDRYALQEVYSVDYDTLEKSFGQEVAEELVSVNISEMMKVLEFVPSLSIIVEDKDEVYDSVMSDCEEGRKNRMRRYFHKIWYEDECRAMKGQERGQGISVDYCLNNFYKDIHEKHTILSELTNIWDTGVAAANFAINHNFVACYNTSGEQSYRVIIENNPYEFFALIAISKLIRKDDVKAGENFGQHRQNVLIKLLDELNTKEKIVDYNDIKNIIIMEDGYLNAWNQVDIINERVLGSELEKIKKDIVIKFIDNNF